MAMAKSLLDVDFLCSLHKPLLTEAKHAFLVVHVHHATACFQDGESEDGRIGG